MVSMAPNFFAKLLSQLWHLRARMVAYIPFYLETRAISEIPSQSLAVVFQRSNFNHILLSRKGQI